MIRWVCNVVDNVNIINLISKTTAIYRWIDVREKKEDKSTKYNVISNVFKPCNDNNYNKLQPLSVPTPFLPVCPSNYLSLSVASLFSCKESTCRGNKEKDVRRIKPKESLQTDMLDDSKKGIVREGGTKEGLEKRRQRLMILQYLTIY